MRLPGPISHPIYPIFTPALKYNTVYHHQKFQLICITTAGYTCVRTTHNIHTNENWKFHLLYCSIVLLFPLFHCFLLFYCFYCSIVSIVLLFCCFYCSIVPIVLPIWWNVATISAFLINFSSISFMCHSNRWFTIPPPGTSLHLTKNKWSAQWWGTCRGEVTSRVTMVGHMQRWSYQWRGTCRGEVPTPPRGGHGTPSIWMTH